MIANQNPGTVERLQNWKLLQYFNVVVASAEAGVAKPDPAIFRMALERAGCTPAQTVMVGDRMDNDVAPAKALGMHSVRVLRGPGAFYLPRSLEEEPEYTIQNLGELVHLFWIKQKRTR